MRIDMATWQCDDKEWMKKRRAEWKTVQKRVNALRFLHKDWKPAVKHYYLTGEHVEGKFRIQNLDIAPLIEMWFDPDTSSENWSRIKKKYEDKIHNNWQWEDSKRRCREVLKELGRSYLGCTNESFFNGLDEKLYDVFFKRGLKREDYPGMTIEEFKKHAWNSYRGIPAGIFQCLIDNTCNPYNAVNYRMEEWHDAILLAYDPERKELQHVIQLIDQALIDPDKFSPEYNALAKKVDEVLNDTTLPEIVKERIKELRARPCHPHCESFED